MVDFCVEIQKRYKKHFSGPYCNHLTFLKLAIEFPLIWFREDSHGGWQRLKTKFALNNLLFEGGLVPTSAIAVKDAIKDLVATCRAQGAEIQTPPSKPLSFIALVKTLEDLGLLSGSTPAPHEVPLPVPDQLQAAHINNVGFHNFQICK